MNGQILVPLDGSLRAEMILPEAVALARATERTIALLLIEPMVDPMFLPSLIGMVPTPTIEHPRWHRSYLARVAERLAAQGIRSQVDVVFGGDIAATILERARAPQIDMIAMATHGRVGVERWLAGSIAEQVLAGASKPLLLMRGRGEQGAHQQKETPAIRTILVALDGSSFAAQALHEARELAETTGATLVLVAVAPMVEDLGLAEGDVEPLWMVVEHKCQVASLQDSLDKIATELRKVGLPVRTQVLAGDPVDTIIRACADETADVLVMATHGRSGMRRLFLGSVATGVLHRAEVPVLLIRPQSQPRASRQVRYGDRAWDRAAGTAETTRG